MNSRSHDLEGLFSEAVDSHLRWVMGELSANFASWDTTVTPDHRTMGYNVHVRVYPVWMNIKMPIMNFTFNYSDGDALHKSIQKIVETQLSLDVFKGNVAELAQIADRIYDIEALLEKPL